jgi:DNA replication factor GINS
MYEEIYKVWKRELESKELEKLPQDFISKIAEYLKKIEEEKRMLDKKTAKAYLLKIEEQNVKRMLNDLTKIRYRKLVEKTAEDKKLSMPLTTTEDKKIFELLSLTESYQSFIKAMFQESTAELKVSHKMAVLRFLGEVPEIIGLDMKTYGPYKPEDVASIPIENAKILVKQGLAEKIEI